MKNIKRFTALVLVIALAASFMITVGAADSELNFSDAKSITAVEAVEVLSNSKVNIIQGFDTGDFQPAGNVTREQAIKMISVALLGGDYGSSLTGMEQLFTDVLGTRWSAGYIAYGVSQNIIVGYGDGKFGPADNVTYGQLAKMLLTALGYGKNGEYEGSGWLLASIGDAKSLGIFKGLDISDYSAPASRNDAAQMIFNGITEGKCVIVNYSKDTEAYVKTTQTIGAKSFDLSKNTAATDKLGRPAHQWKSGKTNISSVYNDGAKLTYTAKVNGTALAKAIKDESLSYTKDIVTTSGSTTTTTKGISFTLTINGEEQSMTLAAFNAGLALTGAFVGYDMTTAEAAAVEMNGTLNNATVTNTAVDRATLFTSGNGVVIEIYADGDDVITDIVVVETYLGEVRSVTAAKGDEDRYVTVRFTDKTGTAKNVNFTTDDFAKGDFVYVTPASTFGYNLSHTDTAGTLTTFPVTVSYAGAATVVDAGSTLRGAVTRVSGDTYTVGGSTYTKAETFKHFTADFDDTYDFYLDEYGYIIGAEVYASTDSSKIDSYLYIEAAASVSSGVTGGFNARAYFMDGTSKVIDLKVRTVSSVDYIGNTSVVAASASIGARFDSSSTRGLVGGFYTYSVNSSDEYTLTALGSKAVQTATETVSSTDYNGPSYVKKGSSSVKVSDASSAADAFIVAGVFTKNLAVGSGTTLSVVDGKLTTYSGASKFPSDGIGSASAKNAGDYLGTLAIYNDNDAITQLVILFKSTATTTNVYGMYTGEYYRDSNGDYFYEFKTVDGKKDYKVSFSGIIASKDYIYELTSDTAISQDVSGTYTGNSYTGNSYTGSGTYDTIQVTVTYEDGTYFKYGSSGTTVSIDDKDSVIVAKGGGADTLEEGDEAYIIVDGGVLVAAFIK